MIDAKDTEMPAGSAEHRGEPGSEPLVFHDRVAQIDRDPQALAYRLAQHYSVLDFGPRRGHEKEFVHRTSSTSAGDLLLSCGYTTPIQGTIGEREEIGSINLILSGTVLYEVQGQKILVNKHRPFFFSPGQEYKYSISNHFNGVVFHIDMSRLRRTAAAMAGLGVSERRFARELDFARALLPGDQRNLQLLELLKRSIGLLDFPTLQTSGDLDHLQVDDLIYRNLALLLCPRLENLIHHDPQNRTSREQIFEELVEWARANLNHPINLSQLEKRSGYSRRNLQLAFQQRFGCGPIQWIRQQRLEQARHDLLNPEPEETVATVASRYGFSSLSVFSRDFRAQFGLRPSELLREGKRHQSDA